ERAGLPAVRYTFRMRRDLVPSGERSAAEPIPELGLPDGLRFAAWTPERDEAARVAKNAAFRDHWGSQPSPPEAWRHLVGQSTARRELSVLVVDEADEIVGLVLQLVPVEDFERQGYASSYLQLIAVTRPWRRRGVAASMMARALRASLDAGLEVAALDVDSQNPSGALALYEGMGFRVVEREQTHQLEY
ncbi:MAG: GNAT family N-acetyltransferase, partial [Microbacteriaceae bacterium]|nr:GNAT family N-acetyltransferase [Microbacteriaceae bacterium]